MVSNKTIEAGDSGHTAAFRLFLVCTFFLLGRPQDFLPFLGLLRPALVLTLIAAAAAFFSGRRREFLSAFSLPESKRYLLFYMIMIAGIPWAYHRGLAFGGVFQGYLINVLFFLLLVSQITSTQRLKSLMWVICMCALVYGVFGGLFSGNGGGRFQMMGNAFDPNDTAYVLLSIFPICLYFVRFNEGVLKRVLALVAVCSSIAVILQTGSRGGLLGLGVVLLTMLLSNIAGMKFGQKVWVVALIVSVFVLTKDRIDLDRYMTLSDISSDYNVSSEGGRIDLWMAAIDLTLANPVMGVGVECYPFANLEARQRAGETYLRWQYTHNSFLQIASEVGLVGFFVFLTVNLRSLQTFLRICSIRVRLPSRELDEVVGMAGVMLLGFLGLLISGFFLSQGYSIYATLYFGLAAAMRRASTEVTS